MKFRSRASVALSFDLGGVHYDVPISGECTIPDSVAYAVEAYGLPLVPDGPMPAVLNAAEPELVPVVRPYSAEQLQQLDASRFQVPKNASRKTLLELCDRFDLGRPPSDIPNKDVAKSIALRLDELRRKRDTSAGAESSED